MDHKPTKDTVKEAEKVFADSLTQPFGKRDSFGFAKGFATLSFAKLHS